MTAPSIQFYQLLTTPLERALPKLMEKAFAQGMRTVVRGSPPQVKRLDDVLWTYDPNSFLPHGDASAPQAERQPIYLTAGEEMPNEAKLLVITDGRMAASPESFERIFDIFDGGNEETIAAARARWSAYKEKGYALTYIRQKDDGGWEKIMSTETA